MGELKSYTRAIQSAQSIGEIADRRRKRLITAKRRARELLRKIQRREEADRRRNRWLNAKRRAIRVLCR